MSITIMVALQVALTGLPQDSTEGCTDKNGTTALSACYSGRADVWEKRLLAAYPLALQHVEGPQREALKRAQNAWLKYRDATCNFYNLERGSIHFIWGAYCSLDLTRNRTLELEQYVLP
ncbi:MAG: lysozyme inhibitor LprI family protein [Sphingomonas bacterium]